jgi:hypothetical protein
VLASEKIIVEIEATNYPQRVPQLLLLFFLQELRTACGATVLQWKFGANMDIVAVRHPLVEPPLLCYLGLVYFFKKKL